MFAFQNFIIKRNSGSLFASKFISSLSKSILEFEWVTYLFFNFVKTICQQINTFENQTFKTLCFSSSYLMRNNHPLFYNK